MSEILEASASDARIALRGFRRNPGFTFFAILTIALGLGANAAIFTLLDGVLLKPVGYPEPERLVQLWERPPRGERNGISGANYLDWQKQSTVFESMAATTGDSLTLSGANEPRQLRAMRVSAAYFKVFGVGPALGRTFAEDEDQPGKDRVVVLSHRIWQSTFGGDRSILGRVITMDNTPYTVVGVMPANSQFDRRWSDLWVPLSFDPKNVTRNFHYLTAVARLKRGVSVEQAQAEMSAIAARIAALYPDIKKDWGARVDRYLDRIVGPQMRLSLIVLMAAVGSVLLIGCANLANLLLARGTLRSREMALRAALGASRGRIARLLLTESLMLASMGAVVGLGIGYALLRLIVAALPPFSLPAEARVEMDWRVLAFIAGATLVTAVLFGLAPALQSSRRDPGDTLKEGGRSSSAGRGKMWVRHAFVAVQVAMAFVLLAGAGLLIRSFQRLTQLDPGFDSTNVVAMYFPLVMGRDVDGPRLTQYVQQTIEQVRAIPGMQDAAMTTGLPLQGSGFGMPLRIPGAGTTKEQRGGCGFKIVTPGYFSTLGIRIKAGRGLTERDVKGAPPVMVVNEPFVKRYFPDQDPLGKRVLIEEIITGKRELGPEIPWEIVGVVGDERSNGLDNTNNGVYVSYAQSPVVGIGMVAKGAGDPALLIKSIQQAVWQVNKSQALDRPRTVDEIKSDSLVSRRLPTVLLGGFAILALLLAAAGIYGVLSFVTAQRTQEIGIRSALGASFWDLVRMVLLGGAAPVLAGLVVGVGGALALTRLMQTLLFETKPNDVATLAGVGIVLLLVGLTACFVPAWKAARTDPATALRHE